MVRAFSDKKDDFKLYMHLRNMMHIEGVDEYMNSEFLQKQKIIMCDCCKNPKAYKLLVTKNGTEKKKTTDGKLFDLLQPKLYDRYNYCLAEIGQTVYDPEQPNE